MTADDCWEARMAARARERHANQVVPVEHDEEWERRWSQIRRDGRAHFAGMTLGQATDYFRQPPWACACVGGPTCCRFRAERAQWLHRAAHIVARQLADLAEKGRP